MAEMLCRPVSLPAERQVEAAQVAIAHNPMNAPLSEMMMAAIALTGGPAAPLPPAHLALLTSRYWGSSGVNLSVSFMESTPADLRNRILEHANAWGQYCNAKFSWVSSGGDVRISRGQGGYWSFLGTDLRLIPPNQQTMNLEGFTMDTPESEYKRVVRHEFGHTLGFPHEHERKEIVDLLDPAKTIAYGASHWGWDEQTVREQVLTPLDPASIRATSEADESSIMAYMLPAEITKNGQPIPGGLDIDQIDAAFAASVYPLPAPPPKPGVQITLLELMDAKGKVLGAFPENPPIVAQWAKAARLRAITAAGQKREWTLKGT